VQPPRKSVFRPRFPDYSQFTPSEYPYKYWLVYGEDGQRVFVYNHEGRDGGLRLVAERQLPVTPTMTKSLAPP
jgi:hypothetical protein